MRDFAEAFKKLNSRDVIMFGHQEDIAELVPQIAEFLENSKTDIGLELVASEFFDRGEAVLVCRSRYDPDRPDHRNTLEKL